MVKDVRKGEIHVEQNIDQEEKEDDPASNCSGSGSNKRKTSIKVKNGKEPAKKKAKGAKEIHVNRWQRIGIQNVEDLSSWTSPEPVRDQYDSSVTLFELFMTDKLIDHICKETKAYAAQKGNHTFKIEPNELKSFLTVFLLSGYIPYPRRSVHWEMSSDSPNTIVASLFTRNRFLDVLQYLHLADNNNLNPSDKFSKVNLLFKMINESYLQNFIPEKNVSIDESMVPYYGRHGCKQYIQNKPVKFGYKLWVAATPLGYAIQFYPYAGKDDNYNKDIGLGGSVVMTLISKLPTVPNSNCHVIMDSFFTSPSFLRLLKGNGMAATGTVRANRAENAPLQAVDDMKKEARGSSDVVNGHKSNVTLAHRKDHKVVTLALTLYGKEPMKRARRYIKDKGGRVEIDQPNSISVYNKTMGGVDRMDQNIGAYMINIRSKKWWWPLFRFCVDLAVNNAFQFYRLQPLQQGEKQLDLLGFRREIVKVYHARFRSDKTLPPIFSAPRSTQRVIPEIRYDGIDHWIAKGNQRRCAKCSKTSKYFCEKCNVGLHPDCFKDFHTR